MDKEDQKPMVVSISDLKIIKSNDQPVATVKRPKYRDIHYSIAGAMAGNVWVWKPFHIKLHRVIDFRGENLAYVEDERGIVRNVSDAYLNSAIAHYWDKVLPVGTDGIHLGAIAAADVDKTRKLWYALSPPVTKPFPLVTWKSDPRPAHHKVSFDPLPVRDCVGKTPLFDELMKRTANSTALMAFIGSLFDENSQCQQYVWIYGDGQNGKGALVRRLNSVLGPVISSEQPPERASKHWTVGLIGKRLVVFPDCEDPAFTRGGLFKSLTGEDRTRVEIKGGAILFMDLPLKFMFTSNKKPDISSGKADKRRIIFCPIKPIEDGGDLNYEAKLEAETPAFISMCHHEWLAYGDSRASISSKNDQDLNDLIERNEIDCAAFVDAYLDVVKEEAAETDYKKLPANQRKFVRPGDMQKLMLNMNIRSKPDRNRLIEYLNTKHNIPLKSIELGHSFPAYLNCRLSLAANEFLSREKPKK